MDQQARRGTQECVGADSLEGHRGAHPHGLRGKEPRGAGEAGRLRHRKEGLAWTRRRPLQDLCPRTSSQERQQAGASEQTLAPGDKSPAVPIWPQSKQSTSALQPPSRPSTCGTRFTAHFPITHRVWKLFALDSHYLKHRQTVPLTWLMKRLLRFSLTVKTKDTTETLLACMRTPCRWLRTGLCVTVPPFHPRRYPAAQLPYKKLDLHTCRPEPG